MMHIDGVIFFTFVCGTFYAGLIIAGTDDTADQEAFLPHTSSKIQNVVSSLSTNMTAVPDSIDDASFSEKSSELSDSTGVGIETKDIPTVLWWTGRLFIQKEYSILRCPKGACRITANKKRLHSKKTRGIIFYGTDFAAEDLPLPRQKYHEWALIHEESPMNNHVFSHGIMMKLFNHTSTFKRDSDYPLTLSLIPSSAYLTERMPITIEEKNRHRKAGIAPVLYVQSHKGVASFRDSYVKELMKYIPVDSYGTCVHNKDLPEDLLDPVENMGSSKFLDFISKYKFHLAFENACCDDYMTEKLFRVFHVGAVPVYMGSSKVQDWTPSEHSVISVDDFNSPKDLAEYLMKLDSDDAEYEKYLTYKQKGGITNKLLVDHMKTRPYGDDNEDLPNFIQGFECHVCEKVYERYRVEKKHELDPNVPLLPPKIADPSHGVCQQPHPHPSLNQEKIIEEVKKENEKAENRGMPGHIDWIEDYWQAFSKALAINKMLEVGEKDPTTFDKYWTQEIRSTDKS